MARPSGYHLAPRDADGIRLDFQRHGLELKATADLLTATVEAGRSTHICPHETKMRAGCGIIAAPYSLA
jgi:hypothetical protein